ncbi:MOSC domain-containing protein [Methylophilus sp. YYY-1]|uniref:MOSC domain-containing protein n=1 Tax=Methylophilus sp. YYY-1 TaxID=2682087 RepID=UPI0023B2E225|nr:MOSC domain-containing protein [Methylophilus sp. YYY-1]MDF0378653.1 MOSC domain-containing protein [Methylophilus sp. YYY-1]
MKKVIGVVQAVCMGTPRALLRPGTTSAILKTAVHVPVKVGFTGLQGDEQADRRLHGGLDKAVHIYPSEHYAQWQQYTRYPSANLMSHGALGENLSTTGLSELTICMGDRLSIGSVMLEVTQTRQPCWKVNDRSGIPDLAQQMQIYRKTGFYCRVLQPGVIAAGDVITLNERPYPDWSLHRILLLLYHSPLDQNELKSALNLPLVDRWRTMFEHRLETSSVESWSARLAGPQRYEPTL